jgi:hypothetical protein
MIEIDALSDLHHEGIWYAFFFFLESERSQLRVPREIRSLKLKA